MRSEIEVSTHITLSERRFRSGDGQKYMKDGMTVRCQANSKSKLNAAYEKLRQELSLKLGRELTDEEWEGQKPDSSEFWPDCQCGLPATPGTFVCKYHGGNSLGMVKKSITDYMPIDLQHIVQTFENNPELLSRYSDMRQLNARNAQLYQQMIDGGGGPELWSEVKEALDLIEYEGQLVEGLMLARQALKGIKTTNEAWAEIRNNIKLLDTLARTQFNIEVQLKTMMSVDQVVAALNKQMDIVIEAVEGEVEDREQSNRIITRIIRATRATFNIGG